MKALRIGNGILLAFIALNAFGGGYYGMTGAENVPVEWLEGSPFRSYFLPSLFLFVVVGGMCTYTSVALFRNRPGARKSAFTCAALLSGWIGAQLLIIGYVSWMQPAILISAVVIAVLAYLSPENA